MFQDPSTTRANMSWHVARRVAVPHGDATHALGEAVRTGAIGPGTIADVTVDSVHHTRPGEARGFTGRLRLDRVFGVIRVEVEVEPWSRSESALGVRPARRPPVYRGDRYFERAIALLGGLETCLLERIVVLPDREEVSRAS